MASPTYLIVDLNCDEKVYVVIVSSTCISKKPGVVYYPPEPINAVKLEKLLVKHQEPGVFWNLFKYVERASSDNLLEAKKTCNKAILQSEFESEIQEATVTGRPIGKPSKRSRLISSQEDGSADDGRDEANNQDLESIPAPWTQEVKQMIEKQNETVNAIASGLRQENRQSVASSDNSFATYLQELTKASLLLLKREDKSFNPQVHPQKFVCFQPPQDTFNAMNSPRQPFSELHTTSLGKASTHSGPTHSR